MSQELEAPSDRYSKFSLADLAEAMRSVKTALDAAKIDQAAIQKEFDLLRLKVIPEKMDDEGMTSVKIKGIGRLTITGDMYAGIQKDMNKQAYQWLTDNGHGDLIKDFVHSSTLKAFLKEQIKNGEEIPDDLFKVTPFERASITKG